MKSQSLFWGKIRIKIGNNWKQFAWNLSLLSVENKKEFLSLSSAEFAQRVVKVNSVVSHYLDFAFLEQSLISKWKSGFCFNMQIKQQVTKYCGKGEKLLLRSNFSAFPLFLKYLLASGVKLHILLWNLIVRFIFSSILKIWYVEVRISQSISESSLDFEITRDDCMIMCIYRENLQARYFYQWVNMYEFSKEYRMNERMVRQERRSHNLRKNTHWHMCSAKTEINLHIRVFVVHLKKLWILGYPKCTQWMCRLIWIFTEGTKIAFLMLRAKGCVPLTFKALNKIVAVDI